MAICAFKMWYYVQTSDVFPDELKKNARGSQFK